MQVGGNNRAVGESGQEVSDAHPVDSRVREHPGEQLSAHSDAGQVPAVRTESGVPRAECVLLAQHGQVSCLRETGGQIRNQMYIC